MTTLTVPCPPWCARPDGHDLAPVDRGLDGLWRRVHLGRPVTDQQGQLLRREQFETACTGGGLWRGVEQVTCVTAAELAVNA